MTFLDNNILADKQWFLDLCEYLHTNHPKMKVDFNQGLDIRLLDDDMAEALSKLRPINDWKFAFDMMSYKDSVLKGIEILKRHLNVRSKCLFYVYLDKDEDVPDAVERARILKENGATAYAMLNLDTVHTKRMKAFKRWTRPWIFWSCDFEEFYGEGLWNLTGWRDGYEGSEMGIRLVSVHPVDHTHHGIQMGRQGI